MIRILWKCEECGKEFAHPTLKSSGDRSPDMPRVVQVCPGCGSDNITPIGGTLETVGGEVNKYARD